MNTFDKYEILDEIGKGGFAAVFRARDKNLDREVALKILDPVLMRNPVWVKRFRQEAKAIARLEHPHIVTIYEVGESEGRLFIAMQLASDGDLAQHIGQQGALAWDETLRITEQVASALDFAHQQGVIHRDLKPSNILFDRTAGALLSDFGLARIFNDNSQSARLTTSHELFGTNVYIAPEALDGQSATAQSDIYALGCVVYEMITGKRLVQGQTPIQVAASILRGIELPPQWPAGVPPGLSQVLAKAVAINPAERYASAGAFVRALAALPAVSPAGTSADRAEATPPPTASTASGRKWPVWAGVIMLLALLLAGGWWMMRGRGGREEVTPSPTAVAQVSAPATSTPTSTITPTFTPTFTPTTTPTETSTPTPTLSPTPTPTLDTSSWQPIIEEGVAAYDRADWEQVVPLFDKALAIMPDNAAGKAEAYNYRGWAYHRLGENEKAIADFSRAIELKPDYARAYNNRGVAYSGLGKYQSAISDFTQAIALGHEPLKWPYASRGWSHYRLKQFDSALSDYNQCLALDADYVPCYLQRGLVYKATGNMERARQDFITCATMDIDGSNGNLCSKKLEALPTPTATPRPAPTATANASRTLFDGDPRDSAWLCDGGFRSECNFSANPACGAADGRIVYGPYCRKKDHPAIDPGLYRVEIEGTGRVRAGATDWGSQKTMFAFAQTEMDLPGSFTFCWPGRAPGGYGFETIIQATGSPATVQRIRLVYLSSSCN